MDENDDVSHKKEKEHNPQRGKNDDGSHKYLAGIIVLAILLVISLLIHAYVFYKNRQLKPLNENVENMTDNSGAAIGDYERMENERWTDAAFEIDENDDPKERINQKETGI